MILANSANTNCRPFQRKINCSKFIMMDFNNDAIWLLVSLFLTSINLLLVVFLQWKILTILQKVTINFRQVSLKGVLLLVRVLEHLDKILQKYLWINQIFKKNFTTHELPHKRFLSFPVNFFHLFTEAGLYRIRQKLSLVYGRYT